MKLETFLQQFLGDGSGDVSLPTQGQRESYTVVGILPEIAHGDMVGDYVKRYYVSNVNWDHENHQVTLEFEYP